jgi:hypothetical protein
MINHWKTKILSARDDLKLWLKSRSGKQGRNKGHVHLAGDSTHVTILVDSQAWPARPSDRNSVIIKLGRKNGDSSDFK